MAMSTATKTPKGEARLIAVVDAAMVWPSGISDKRKEEIERELGLTLASLKLEH